MLRPLQTPTLLRRLSTALVLAALVLPAARPALAQDFSGLCDGSGDAFVVQGDEGQATTGLFELFPAGDALTLDRLGTIEADVNALVFYEDYLYGSVPGTSDLVQIASDGAIANRYTIPFLPAGNYITGAVDASSGELYLNASNSPTIYVVDLTAPSTTRVRFFSVSGAATDLETTDFAYVDGALYGYGDGADGLYRIDAETGALSFVDVSPPLPTDVSYGAVWASASDDVLYLYANEAGQVYRVDLDEATSQPAGSVPALGAQDRNDGAACTDFVPFEEQEALPVELASFEAVVDGQDVLLRWQTLSETNNAGFEVERHDGGAWERLAFVEGRGTTAEAQPYRHRVEALPPGTHRFRLKQLDHDGAFAYGPEAEVRVGLPTTHELTAAYPNPFNPQTSLELTVAQQQEVTVAAYDVLGRRVATLFAGTMAAGQSETLVFEAGALPSGLYVLQAEGETFTATQRVTLAK